MKSGFNYGLLFTVGGMAFIVIVGEIVLWYSRRAEAKGEGPKPDVAERLERAEAHDQRGERGAREREGGLDCYAVAALASRPRRGSQGRDDARHEFDAGEPEA